MKIDYEGVYTLASDMFNIQNNIKNEVENIKSDIDSLIKSGEWTSMASSYYQDKISNSFNEFNDLFNSIQGFINQMNTSMDLYKNIDTQVINSVKNLNVKNLTIGSSIGARHV